MTFAALLLLAIGQQPIEQGWMGQVTGAVETVKLTRGEQQYRAAAGSSLRDEDRLMTPAHGAAVLFLFDGASVYLGPETTTVLERVEGKPTLRLVRGQIRLVSSAKQSMRLRTPSGEAIVAEGAVWAQATPTGSRFWAETDGVQLRTTTATANKPQPAVRRAEYRQPTADSDSIALPIGHERSITVIGEVSAARDGDPSSWNIPLDGVQLAGCLERWRGRRRGCIVEVCPPEPPCDPPPKPEPTPEPPPTEEPVTEPTAATESEDDLSLLATGSALSLALGDVSGSSAALASGGLFSDAQQESVNLAFPGSIHLITAQSSYTLNGVSLTAADNFPAARQFWSIGLGPSPTGQVRTDFITGTGLTPRTIRIPGFDAYVVQLNQFGLADPVTNPVAQVGITGLVNVPRAPSIQGATPLTDERAAINNRATFALGELAVGVTGNNPTFDLRRSDQDRTIIKDLAPNPNDDNDIITPNPQVAQFDDVPDNRFMPQVPAPGVKVPRQNSFAPVPTYSGLTGSSANFLRKAAFTTLVADQLFDFSRRTGQTRFVVDGKIVDITGYRR